MNSMIFFILGGSGIGKSTVAKRLCRNYSLQYVAADVVRQQLYESTEYTQISSTISKDESYTLENQDLLLKEHKALSEYVARAMHAYIHAQLTQGIPSLYEGDDITVSLLARLKRENINYAAICIYDDNPEHVANNIDTRDDTIFLPYTSVMKNQLLHAYLNGQRIKSEAKSYGVPLVPSRPFASLAFRCARALQLRL